MSETKIIRTDAPLRVELALLTTPEQLEQLARLMRITSPHGVHNVPELTSPDGTCVVRLFNTDDPHVARQLAADDAERQARRSGTKPTLVIPGGPIQ